MKKLIISAIVPIAIASTALIAVPALASGPQHRVQVPASVTTPYNGMYAGYGSAFCAGGLALGDTTTLQKMADTLGITYTQLIADLNNGQSIASIAAAQKVDLAKVVDVVVAAQTDIVNTLVKNGYITQAQADAILSNMRASVEAALSLTHLTGNVGYGMMNGTYGYGMMGGTFGGMMNGAYGYGPGTTVTPPVAGPVTGYGMLGGAGRGMMGR
jgi:hypothetical protein